MKRYIILAVLALGFIVNVNAQIGKSSDGFFTPNYNELRKTSNDISNEMGDMPAILGHGYETNQSGTTPIGSGLLLLAGMGLAYGIKKSKKN